MTDTATPLNAPIPRARLRPVFNGWSLAAFAVAGLLSIPVLIVALQLFTPPGEVWDHIASTVLYRYASNTFWLMLGVGIGVFVVGTGTAWLVTMCEFPGRRSFEWLLLLPFAIPAYVIAYAYTGVLDYAGPVQSLLRDIFGWTSSQDYWFPDVRTLGGAISVMTLVLYPYVYLLARSAFLEQSVCALEVSRTLGASGWRSFTRVALPLARPSIVTGLALALMETLNDFGTVQHFAVDTFTAGIYRTWLGMGEQAAAAQLAAILMSVVLVLILLERWSRGEAKYHQATQTWRALPRYRLHGWRKAVASIACGAPVFLGFILPLLMLGVWTVQNLDWVDSRFVSAAWNSFILAGTTAALAVGLALLLGYSQRLRPGRAGLFANRIAAMGYAVPGAVIAVGILIAFSWLRTTTGLLLTGTVFALIFAYLVRFLAVSLNTVEAGLGRITRNMDGAARTLGLGPFGVLTRVHMPIMRASLLTAATLVFVDVMKELPATLIIRPFNFDTLAVRVFELASDELLAEAAPGALAIVAVGIVPVLILCRAIARSRPGEDRKKHQASQAAGS